MPRCIKKQWIFCGRTSGNAYRPRCLPSYTSRSSDTHLPSLRIIPISISQVVAHCNIRKVAQCQSGLVYFVKVAQCQWPCILWLQWAGDGSYTQRPGRIATFSKLPSTALTSLSYYNGKALKAKWRGKGYWEKNQLEIRGLTWQWKWHYYMQYRMCVRWGHLLYLLLCSDGHIVNISNHLWMGCTSWPTIPFPVFVRGEWKLQQRPLFRMAKSWMEINDFI